MCSTRIARRAAPGTTPAGRRMSRPAARPAQPRLPAAPRRPSRRGAAAGPSGPVHRAAQHDRGSPRPRRPAVGGRAGRAGRGGTLPGPSDLTTGSVSGLVSPFTPALTGRVRHLRARPTPGWRRRRHRAGYADPSRCVPAAQQGDPAGTGDACVSRVAPVSALPLPRPKDRGGFGLGGGSGAP
jgi:hypothetical protein